MRQGIAISGGGAYIAAFTLGAMKRLHEAGILASTTEFATVSGGSFIGHIFELTMMHKDLSDPTWFERYIRKSVYQFFSETTYWDAAATIVNPINWSDLYTALLDLSKVFSARYPEFDNLTWIVNDRLFQFIYVNLNKRMLDYNSSDLFTYDGQAHYEALLRVFRCTFPIFFLQGVVSVDAGAIDNSTGVAFLAETPLDRLFLFSIGVRDERPTIDPGDYISLLNSVQDIPSLLSSATSDSSAKIYDDLLPQLYECRGKEYASIYPSRKYDPEFIQTDCTESILTLRGLTTFYQSALNGLFFNNEPVIRIVENHGYVQMDAHLRQYMSSLVPSVPFELPNPEYGDKEKNTRIINAFIDTPLEYSLFEGFKEHFFCIPSTW